MDVSDNNSIESAYKAIAELNQRGVPTFIEAFDAPQVGVRVGFVKDNNGNIIEFSGAMNSARETRQPSK